MIDYFKYAVDAEGICTLTIDQPDSTTNVMDQNFIDSFRAALERAIADQAVTGIILTSAKASFVAGADLKSLEATLTTKQDAKTLFDQCWGFSSLLRWMEKAGKPIVAALNALPSPVVAGDWSGNSSVVPARVTGRLASSLTTL